MHLAKILGNQGETGSGKAVIVAVLLSGLVTTMAGLAVPAQAQVAWQKDVTQALASARDQKKYVFLLLTNPDR